MNEDAVEPQDVAEIEQEVPEQDVQENIDHETEAYEKTMVPLSALQKKRERVKELELELQWERQRNEKQAALVDDDSRYESATREEVKHSQAETVRLIKEDLWASNNPEKCEYVNKYLPQFLKERPNLALAINSAKNRLEEAYELMDKLSSKQQQQLKTTTQGARKPAPNAPGGIPKAAAMNETIDVMNMSDSEFTAWRQSQKRKR